MKYEELLEARDKIENKFNELMEEVHRLQGEHRALTNLMDKNPKITDTKTIEVVEKITNATK